LYSVDMCGFYLCNGDNQSDGYAPSLPLCSREGGTAVPDEIEVPI